MAPTPIQRRVCPGLAYPYLPSLCLGRARPENWGHLHCTAGSSRSLLQSERTQGFAADPGYWKGEVFAYVGLPQNLKDLKGYFAHTKQPNPRTLQWAHAWGPMVQLSFAPLR